MYAKMEIEAAGPSETIKERNGKWWWADEAGDWHGPCSSRDSALNRQYLYASDLMGTCNFVLARDWKSRKEREPETCIHPCNVPEPWDCECAGACSCHWEDE